MEISDAFVATLAVLEMHVLFCETLKAELIELS